MSRKKSNRKEQKPVSPSSVSRRKFLMIGAGAVVAGGAGLAAAYRGGWFASQNAAVTGGGSAVSALQAVDQMLQDRSRELNNPSTLIHAVRGFGRDFRLADGSPAVDYLCGRFAADNEVNGRRLVFFKRDAEVHENSFLKTFLEAGVGFDREIRVGERKYTLRDLAESGKSLFRCDPGNLFRYDEQQYRYDAAYTPPRPQIPGQPAGDGRGEFIHEHLPWGLIAFSMLVSPAEGGWTNAYGEKIDLMAIIDQSLREYESTCALGLEEMMRGEAAPENFREEIKKYSCFGMHTAYSYLVCLKNGYRQNNLPERIRQMMDLITYRLKSDAEAIDREYRLEGRGAPPQVIDAFRTRALIKLYGHAFESINYARLHRLITFTPGQERRIEAGEQVMAENILRIYRMDWSMLRQTLGEKFISDIVIALGHASRAMKLLTPENPDAIA